MSFVTHQINVKQFKLLHPIILLLLLMWMSELVYTHLN
jgi:hypothetical protein